MADLDEYRRKRRPGLTPEPFGSAEEPPGSRFVIQRHRARRLHYDVRLEREGALASWAVPRGLPLLPGLRHLAVRTEDHPLEYLTFAGRIPAGEYGAGTIEIWDSGTFELLEEKPDGGLTVRLAGARRSGVWTFVPAGLDGDSRNWLVLRKPDDAVPAAGREYEPMLATPAHGIPGGSDWLFEVKWDGFRALAYLAGGEPRLLSRQGHDLGARFAGLVPALAPAMRTPDCVLDGEVVALDEQGRPDFSALQAGAGRIVYYAFDLLEEDLRPLVDRPLAERRFRLQELLDPDDATVRLSEAVDDGHALLRFARAEGLEGVLAKRRGSLYRPGRRSPDWLKVKTRERGEFVVVGFTRGQGRRAATFGALVLATASAGGLTWVGNCGAGFADAELDRVRTLLDGRRRAGSPLAGSRRPRELPVSEVVWVDPDLACDVEFAERTREGRLRAPVYRGVRVAEAPATPLLERELSRGRRTLRLTNLTKPFWPEDGITKGDLLAYYEAVAAIVVPHVAGRLFTMKRYPDGIHGGHFFQKDAPGHMPAWIRRRRVDTVSRGSGRERSIDYAIVDDELGLLWMANMGCIDLNVTLSRVDRLDRPDVVLFDLDPTPEAGFAGAVAVARLVRAALDALGLVGYPKTSGADGVHVLVPVARTHTFAETRLLAATIAGALARSYPELVTTEFRRSRRRGVLIDANQNGEGRTIAAAYSVRPYPGATVSAPLDWEELTDDLDPRAFTMATVTQRLQERGDLAAGALGGRQSIRTALKGLA